MLESEIWKYIKRELSLDNTIEQEVFNVYVSGAKFVQNNDNNFYLVVKSTFAIKMIEPLTNKIALLIKDKTNYHPILKVITEDEYKNKKRFIKNNNNIIKNNDLSFYSFVTGPSNLQAYTAAQAIIENPGHWNPLFIYGQSGLGKTHLLHAIVYEFKNKYPDLKVIFLSSDEFARRVVDSLHQGHINVENFKNEICQNNVLLIDDIQFLAKKDKTNEILFTIFNHFIENGNQLVFSSDKLPEQLNGFDTRLITRFNLGLSTPIRSLDFDTALAIVEAEMKNQNVTQVTQDVKLYIAKFFANDVRKIKGSISKINFWIMMNKSKQPIDMNIISELFKDIPTTNLGKLNVKKIKEVVSEKFGINIKMIDGKARTLEITTARHIAMYLTQEILGHNLTQIGAEFGGRDHTTVMSAIKKIKNNLIKDATLKKQINVIKNKILSV